MKIRSILKLMSKSQIQKHLRWKGSCPACSRHASSAQIGPKLISSSPKSKKCIYWGKIAATLNFFFEIFVLHVIWYNPPNICKLQKSIKLKYCMLFGKVLLDANRRPYFLQTQVKLSRQLIGKFSLNSCGISFFP